MKTLTAVLVVTVLVIHISGYLIHVPTPPNVDFRETVPVQWLHIQKLMIPLFENVCEDSGNTIVRRLSQEFTADFGDYLEPEVITNLQKLRSAGLLPKGEIFSEYNPEHMKELKIIYNVLSSARNFDAFYKTAAWARQNLNCGLYVNAIYMSIQSRRDTEKISIPAPYEVLPNYFVRKDVLVQASSILAGQEITPTEGVRDEGNAYYIDANYTAMFYDNDDDSKLAYFREDIGLNSYYFLRKLRLSPWLNDDINSRYGENMYQMMKQFMARYNLERYANGLPEIDGIDWNTLPDIPYDPELIYSDGSDFIHRTTPLEFTGNEEIALLQTIENNIVSVVGHMRQSGYNKNQILNHLMEILVTGERSYETLARQLLGKDRTYNGHVSVLEHYMTSLRDPMFWKINKKIVDLVDSALKMLPTYSRNELYFPGVEVVNIEVKKMMTAYDYFEFDVTDALKLDNSNSTFNIKIGQPRLNHKPFSIKVNISSLVTKKGLLKIYLGPKLMPGELAAKKNLFTLLDIFEVNLKIGTNIISRSSDDMKHFAADFMSLKTLRKKLEDAEFGLDSLPLKNIESQIGYPSRLILPKGSPLGLPIQMFVFVAPFTKASVSDSYSANSMEFNSAILSPGYPLDLVIEDRQLFALPNALVKYVTVTQKGDSKVENYGGPGVTKQWYSTNSYDPSSRPNYSTNNKKPFDCQAKKGPSVNSDTNFANTNDYNLNIVSQETVFDETNPSDKTTDLSHLKFLAVASLEDKKVDSVSTVVDTTYKNSYDDKTSREKSVKKEYLSKSGSYSKHKPLTLEEDISVIPIVTAPNNADINKENQGNIENTPQRLLKATKYGYSSKSKNSEPFDYKAKKAEFDRKDYSDKKGEHNINQSFTPEEEEVKEDPTKPAPIYESVMPGVEIQDNMITHPSLNVLKLSKYDYSSKSRSSEPFDYKAKKAEFDRKDFSNKRGDYNKYRSLTPVEEEVAITTTETTPMYENVISDTERQDNANFNTVRLLKSTKFDYASKRKEPFDYKAKKAEFDKKDYSAKRGDYTKYRTITPKEEDVVTTTPTITISESSDELARVVLNKDINNVNLVNEIKENTINVPDTDDIPTDDDFMNIDSKDIEPFPFQIKRRIPTVYDFLFHTFDYEASPEIKVYE